MRFICLGLTGGPGLYKPGRVAVYDVQAGTRMTAVEQKDIIVFREIYMTLVGPRLNSKVLVISTPHDDGQQFTMLALRYFSHQMLATLT